MNSAEIRKMLDDPSYINRAVDAIADDIVDGRMPLSYEMKTGYIGASYGPRGRANAEAIDMIYAGKTYAEVRETTGLNYAQVKNLKRYIPGVKVAQPKCRRAA